MSSLMESDHSNYAKQESHDWDSLPESTKKYIDRAARNDDWLKLVWLMESSVVTFEKMVLHICSLKLEDPLINVLIAFEKTTLALDVIEVLTEPEDLEKKNFKGDTALHVAAAMENIRVAWALLEKNPRLIFITNNLNETPLHKAALYGKRDIFWELLLRGSRVYARRYDGATILHCAVMDHHFELALEIAQGYPDLIEMRDQLGLTVLHHMVTMTDVFSKDRNLNPFEAFIYNCIVLEKPAYEKTKTPVTSTPCGHTSEADGGIPLHEKPADSASGATKTEEVQHYLSTDEADEEMGFKVQIGTSCTPTLGEDEEDCLTDDFPMGSKKGVFGRYEMLEDDKQKEKTLNTDDEKLVLPSNNLKKLYMESVKNAKLLITRSMIRLNRKELIELKKKHEFAKNLMTLIANKSVYWTSLSLGSYKDTNRRNKKPDNMVERWMETPLTLGAKMGLDQLVIDILKQHPGAAKYLGKDGKNVLHVAIEYRQVEILEMVESKALMDPRLIYWLASAVDSFGDTILHLAARPINKTSSSMQMVEEFRWFERVMKLVPGDLVNQRNEEGKTPQEVFSESHKEMVKDAKQQLTNTARSCCAALVSAVTFAAGFSIAKDQDDKPKAEHDKLAFAIFSHSYVIGLSCAAIAFVQFMSLLMSSFTEQDFRRSVPTQYILAIISLFLALLSMLVAFACNTFESLYGGSRPNWSNIIPILCEILFFPALWFTILYYQGVRFRFFSIFRSFRR